MEKLHQNYSLFFYKAQQDCEVYQLIDLFSEECNYCRNSHLLFFLIDDNFVIFTAVTFDCSCNIPNLFATSL